MLISLRLLFVLIWPLSRVVRAQIASRSLSGKEYFYHLGLRKILAQNDLQNNTGNTLTHVENTSFILVNKGILGLSMAGKDFRDQLESAKNQMQNPQQQPQARDKRRAREAKRAGEPTDIGAPAEPRATSEGRPDYDSTSDSAEMERRRRNTVEGPGVPGEEYKGGDMRLSAFGYGPGSKPSYRKDEKAPGTFLPDKPPTKVGTEVQPKKDKERQPEKTKQTPEQIFQIHALADQLLSVVHSAEITIDILNKFNVDDEYTKRAKDLLEKVNKAGNTLLDEATLEGMLHLKLIMRKIALDIVRMPINYAIDIPEVYRKDYDNAFKQIVDFGKEAEVQGAREVAPAMIQERAELGIARQTGLKVLRPEKGLASSTWIPSTAIHIPTKFKNLPLDEDDAARESINSETNKRTEDEAEAARRQEARNELLPIPEAEFLTAIDVVQKIMEKGKELTPGRLFEYSGKTISQERAKRIIQELRDRGILE